MQAGRRAPPAAALTCSTSLRERLKQALEGVIVERGRSRRVKNRGVIALAGAVL